MKMLKNYRLMIALVCSFAAAFAHAKVERIATTNDPAAATKSAEKVLKTTGLSQIMSEVKEPKAEWVKANNGLKEVVLDSNGFDVKKMTGVIKVVAIATNGQTSVVAISDQAKISKMKADALSKTLKESDLL